ncbi:MAG: PAS domain-containing protein [Acetobacteraceae bacterium]|nr:PAS domain-containing protein [Acetobacteraceae bacterium]
MINDAKLIGALYAENNLAPHVFTPRRIAVLKLLALQTAISLEKTRVYRELEEREARIRHLVDANLIGIFVRHNDGNILEANKAFLDLLGYSREDLAAGRLRWTDLTPPEWQDRSVHALAEFEMTGTFRALKRSTSGKTAAAYPSWSVGRGSPRNRSWASPLS